MLTAIDQIVHQEIDFRDPGVAIAVVEDGKLVHSEGYGVANLEWNCPIRLDTVFCLASITKQFTATAIMLLEREGKLRLDDPITTYLPDYPTHDRTITITHLLNHTSGIKTIPRSTTLSRISLKRMCHLAICWPTSKISRSNLNPEHASCTIIQAIICGLDY